MDFSRHNEHVRSLMDAFRRGEAPRVPASISTPTRFFVFCAEINRRGYTFTDYYNDPDVMWELQLEGRRWFSTNLIGDRPMGPPATQWPGVVVDFHGGGEEAYLGNEILCQPDQVLDSLPFLLDDKQRLDRLPLPDPMRSGWLAKQREFFEAFEDTRKRKDYHGLPVGPTQVRLGTDGPFTVAQKLRGTAEFCLDLVQDPAFARRLLHYVTEATVRYIEAWAPIVGQQFPKQSWGIADDSICLINEAMYREFVLPCHRRLYETFSTGGPNSMHCCGPAHHLHRTLVDELNIRHLDCGYATDVAFAREHVGPEIAYNWRFNPRLLCSRSADGTADAVRRMFASGACEGRRLMIQEVAYAQLRPRRWQEMYDAIRGTCVY